MKVKDLVPFIEDVFYKNGKPTGQKFLSYGKIIQIDHETKNKIKTISILHIFEIQKYIDFDGFYEENTSLYAHQIRKYSFADLPREFKSLV